MPHTKSAACLCILPQRRKNVNLFSAVRAAAERGRRDPDMLVKDRAEMLRIFIPDLGGNRADALVTVQQQLLGTLNPLCNHIVFDRDTGLLRKDIT